MKEVRKIKELTGGMFSRAPTTGFAKCVGLDRLVGAGGLLVGGGIAGWVQEG